MQVGWTAALSNKISRDWVWTTFPSAIAQIWPLQAVYIPAFTEAVTLFVYVLACYEV